MLRATGSRNCCVKYDDHKLLVLYSYCLYNFVTWSSKVNIWMKWLPFINRPDFLYPWLTTQSRICEFSVGRSNELSIMAVDFHVHPPASAQMSGHRYAITYTTLLFNETPRASRESATVAAFHTCWFSASFSCCLAVFRPRFRSHQLLFIRLDFFLTAVTRILEARVRTASIAKGQITYELYYAAIWIHNFV